jgi:hypothetical protein
MFFVAYYKFSFLSSIVCFSLVLARQALHTHSGPVIRTLRALALRFLGGLVLERLDHQGEGRWDERVFFNKLR